MAGALAAAAAAALSVLAVAAADPTRDASWDIISGDTAAPGEFPWMVQLKRDGSHICGGVLVADIWVLTAAHCLAAQSDVTAYQVILGEYNVTVEEGSEQRRGVAEIVSFSGRLDLPAASPLFDQANDIAMIRIDQPAIYTKYVKPITLPDAADDFSGMTAVAAGWGASGATATGPVYPGVLQKINMSILSDATCQEDLIFFDFVPRTMSCAQPPKGASLCWGDSGGALTHYKFDNIPLLAAVASWGVDCTMSQLPTVFADVTVYVEWINHLIGSQPTVIT